MLNYLEASDVIREAEIKTMKDYRSYWLANKKEMMKIGMPAHPNKYYQSHHMKK